MPPRSDSPPSSDVVAQALKVLVSQGLAGQAAHATLRTMARERGLSVTCCAALIVSSLDGRVN